MPHEPFKSWTPRSHNNRVLLVRAVEIIEDYASRGYQLSVRQVYYQMVSRKVIPNSTEWYEKLGDVINHGRMSGYIDWDSIVDRGRTPIMPSHWQTPSDMLDTAARAYRVDRWALQDCHLEVWCEKDALSGIIEPVCNRMHVRYLANRGYLSATAMYDAAKRFQSAADDGREPVLIHLGDHDPSGLDMTRDIAARLDVMTHETGITIERIALNRDQVDLYDPPPNPAKLSDSRAPRYVQQHGAQSWELDALEPQVLETLVEDAISGYLNQHLYDYMVRLEEEGREAIRQAAQNLEDPGTDDT